MTERKITIEHCNAVDRAEISITENRLNIKYGPNGIGKSTIAKAIVSASKGNDDLANLLPFKHRGSVGDEKPTVTGVDGISEVLVFDENYVSQFTFQRDEVVKNSFDIFINTEDFQSDQAGIEELFSGIKSSFKDSAEIDQAITNLRGLRDAFSVTQGGKLTKSSKGFKAVGSGNPVENIPPALAGFKDFIQSENTPKWITWQASGNAFLDLSDNCPYCASSLKDDGKKEIATEVSRKYNSKSVEHLNALQEIIGRLGKYLSSDAKEKLDDITKSKTDLSPEQATFLVNLRSTVGTLLLKLENLRSISFQKLKDISTLDDEIKNLKIDMTLLEGVDTEETRGVVDPINTQIDELCEKIGQLIGKVNIHKQKIAKAIEKNQTHINGFLAAAGYKYSVQILSEDETYKMKLVHDDFEGHLDAASDHLSYGERNAFALVLFMHEVRRKKPDLAIFDDPVSSFDKTKKFAIFQQLFRGKDGIRDTTSLMLTHDLEPAIDIIKVAGEKWKTAENELPIASYLSSSAGVVTEQVITPDDIKTFSEICRENVAQSDSKIIKCIYLRRHFEILGQKGLEYNLLSCLLHGRQSPDMMDDGEIRQLTDAEITEATKGIRDLYPDFCYTEILGIVLDVDQLKRLFSEAIAGYEKLQIFRIISERGNSGVELADDGQKNILKKFVDEAFHVENEYVVQLNPREFDSVPRYVIDGLSASIGVI